MQINLHWAREKSSDFVAIICVVDIVKKCGFWNSFHSRARTHTHIFMHANSKQMLLVYHVTGKIKPQNKHYIRQNWNENDFAFTKNPYAIHSYLLYVRNRPHISTVDMNLNCIYIFFHGNIVCIFPNLDLFNWWLKQFCSLYSTVPHGWR